MFRNVEKWLSDDALYFSSFFLFSFGDVFFWMNDEYSFWWTHIHISTAYLVKLLIIVCTEKKWWFGCCRVWKLAHFVFHHFVHTIYTEKMSFPSIIILIKMMMIMLSKFWIGFGHTTNQANRKKIILCLSIWIIDNFFPFSHCSVVVDDDIVFRLTS